MLLTITARLDFGLAVCLEPQVALLLLLQSPHLLFRLVLLPIQVVDELAEVLELLAVLSHLLQVLEGAAAVLLPLQQLVLWWQMRALVSEVRALTTIYLLLAVLVRPVVNGIELLLGAGRLLMEHIRLVL